MLTLLFQRFPYVVILSRGPAFPPGHRILAGPFLFLRPSVVVEPLGWAPIAQKTYLAVLLPVPTAASLGSAPTVANGRLHGAGGAGRGALPLE